MTEHLTEQHIDSFRRKRMSPEGLLSLHRHLAVCETCRARLSTPGQLNFALAAFEREIQQAERVEEHLRYQQLSGYVDDELREIEREIVESHLEACAECAAEVSDLLAFKSTIAVKENEITRTPARSEQSTARWNWQARWQPVHVAAAAAIIIVILTAAVVFLRTVISRQDKAQIAQSPKTTVEATPQSALPLPSPTAQPQAKPQDDTGQTSTINRVMPPTQPEKPFGSSRGEGRPSSSSQIVVSLKDGERVVTLDSSGRVSGLAAGAPDVERLLAVALRSQRLEKPVVLENLIRGPSVQLNSPGQSSSFALQQPVGTIVLSDRPTFIWGALEGATSYTVSIFDAELNEVARSEALTMTAWTVPHALRRGAIYRWQVIARKDGREVVLPSPTAPEAKFKVLDQQQAAAIARAQRIYANSHLALGVLYAQRGLLDEAETELEAVVKDNPASTVAKKLLESLRAWRSARAQTARE